MPSPSQNDQHWSLDKRVNIGLIIGLLAQLVGFGWYAGMMDRKIDELDRRTIRTEVRLGEVDKDGREISLRLVRLEEKSGSMLAILQRIERVIDGRGERGSTRSAP